MVVSLVGRKYAGVKKSAIILSDLLSVIGFRPTIVSFHDYLVQEAGKRGRDCSTVRNALIVEFGPDVLRARVCKTVDEDLKDNCLPIVIGAAHRRDHEFLKRYNAHQISIASRVELRHFRAKRAGVELSLEEFRAWEVAQGALEIDQVLSFSGAQVENNKALADLYAAWAGHAQLISQFN